MELDVGTEHFTYHYATEAAARGAWERASKRCRRLGIFRIRLAQEQYVVVLWEGLEDQTREVAKARHLLKRGGQLVDTPTRALTALRARRRALLKRTLATGSTQRRYERWRRGALLGPDGTTMPIGDE